MICVACLRQRNETADADMVLNGDSLCLTHGQARMSQGADLYAIAEARQRLSESRR